MEYSPPLCNHRELYPPLEEFLKVLQDEGIMDRMSKQSTLKYNAIDRFSINLFKKLKLLHLPGISAAFNQTRGKGIIASHIIHLRKHTDKSSVFEELRKFGTKDSSKLYIIKNDIENCAGFDVLLTNIESTFQHLVVSSDNNRVANDALRVCGILLLPKYRGTVDGILNKKRQDRSKNDQPVDVETAFFEEAVGDFNDPSVVICHPKNVNLLTEYEKLDPNDITRIEIPRDGKWFRDCWEKYFRHNYRKYLRKWNKDTGGGGGRSECFEDFCENHKWVCWVFLLDEENSFLLASTSSGNAPKHLSNESGFSSGDNNRSTNGDEINYLKNNHGKLIRKANDNNEKISSIVDNAQDVIAGLHEIVNKVGKKQDLDEDPKSQAYNQYARITKNQNMIANDEFCSPAKKKRLLDKLKKEKTKYIDIIEAETPTRATPTRAMPTRSMNALGQNKSPNTPDSDTDYDFM